MNGKRIEINLLALMGVVLMISAMFFPWWSFAMEFNEPTYLYPYLLDGPATEIIGYKRSPQMTLLTGVLFACIVLALIGAFSPKRRSRWLLIADPADPKSVARLRRFPHVGTSSKATGQRALTQRLRM